jgi:hypothetical protein
MDDMARSSAVPHHHQAKKAPLTAPSSSSGRQGPIVISVDEASDSEDETRAATYFGDNLDEADLVEEIELSKEQAKGVLKKVPDDFAGPKVVKSHGARQVDKDGRVHFHLATRGLPDAERTPGDLWERATKAVEGLRKGECSCAYIGVVREKLHADDERWSCPFS